MTQAPQLLAAPVQDTTAHSSKGAQSSSNLAIHLDPAQTQIRFAVRSLFHGVRGTFQLKSGTVVVDPHSGLAQGEVLVDATTGKAGDSATTDRMQRVVLETDRYPSIFFHPEHLKGALPVRDGEADLAADGIFNMHGTDHPLQLTLHVARTGDALTVTAHFTVPYVQWGMRNPGHYGKQAEVDLVSRGTVVSEAMAK